MASRLLFSRVGGSARRLLSGGYGGVGASPNMAVGLLSVPARIAQIRRSVTARDPSGSKGFTAVDCFLVWLFLPITWYRLRNYGKYSDSTAGLRDIFELNYSHIQKLRNMQLSKEERNVLRSKVKELEKKLAVLEKKS